MRAADVDLDDLLALRVVLPVREVGAEHQDEVGAVERALGGRVADEAGLADLERVLALEPLLGLEREDHRRGQVVGEAQDVLARLARADAGEQRDAARGVDARRGVAEPAPGRARPSAGRSTNEGAPTPFGMSSPATSPGSVITATLRSVSAAWTARSSMNGICSGLVSVRQKAETSLKSASLSTSWKNSEPISASGT